MLEDKNQKRTSIASLGEFGLIEHLTKHFKINQESTLKNIGIVLQKKTVLKKIKNG